MRIHAAFVLLLLALPWAPAPGTASPAAAALSARDAWIRETPPGRTVSAGYLTIDNAGPEPLTLVAASSSQAARVEFHTHSHVDGMMRMRRVEEVEVPAGGSVSFAPGGLHLMLFETASPRAGAEIDVALQTATGDRLELVFPVRRDAPAQGDSR